MNAPFVLVLLAACAIAGASAYLGSLMLSRRMALVAGPLGHLTLPGVAVALMLGVDVSLGAFPFVLAGAFAIWLLEARTKLPMETLTALVFASGVATAFLFLPLGEAESALVGDLAMMRTADAGWSIAAALAIAAVVHRVYRDLVLVNLSEDLAACEGIDPRRANLVYLLLIAVVVALGVKMVGGLLTAALVAIPAAAARNLTRSLPAYAMGATAIGVASAAIGVALFALTGRPAGPLVVVTSAAIFLLTLPFAR
jgi:ABC-type Mn2+/Zn2+ transport system permease subunit